MKKQSLKYSKTEPSVRKSNKSPTSPTNNVKIDDQQTSQELLKTQQSFRSSTSRPGQSPSITSKFTGSVASPQRNAQKRQSQIISKAQLQNMHERSIIKVLGMNMEAVCSKKNHEKNKMLYFCQYGDCKADNRLACSYCLVEQHNDHSQSIMDVQTFCKIFDDRNKQMQNLVATILKVPDRTQQIKYFFEKLAQQIIDRLQQIEKNILESIQEQLAWKPLEQDIVNRLNELSSKQIFEMTQEDLKESLDFVQGKHIKELEFIKQETNNYLSQKVIQVDQTWNDYKQQLELDIQNTIGDNNQIIFLDPKSKEYLQYKVKYYEQKYHKNQEYKQPYKQQLETIIEEERKEEERIQEEIKQQELIEQQKKEEEIKKQEEIQKKQEEIKKKEKLESQRIEKNSERERLLKTFPYKIFTDDCTHRFKCNTIPIFQCCNKAYPCQICHGYSAHPPRIQIPSYRYCMKCLEIYLVMYPTNQPVNCLKCQK